MKKPELEFECEKGHKFKSNDWTSTVVREDAYGECEVKIQTRCPFCNMYVYNYGGDLSSIFDKLIALEHIIELLVK